MRNYTTAEQGVTLYRDRREYLFSLCNDGDWLLKIVREMGYTHSDFFRLLPGAMGEYDYAVSGTTVTCQIGSGRLTVSLGPEGERRLVLVVIPRTEITFDFENVADADQIEFLRYFDLRFMKGLG